jgi:hypothetical protein
MESSPQYLWYILFVSSITKIGAVLLIVFGIRILINFYRYNTLLTSFYSSRADALEIFTTEKFDELERIATVLSTEKIHFGKVPDHPYKEMFKILENVVKKAEKTKVV